MTDIILSLPKSGVWTSDFPEQHGSPVRQTIAAVEQSILRRLTIRKKEEASTTARVTERLYTGVARPNPRALRSVLGTKVIIDFAYHSVRAASVASRSRAMTQSVSPVVSSLGSGAETRGHLWDDTLLERCVVYPAKEAT